MCTMVTMNAIIVIALITVSTTVMAIASTLVSMA